MADTSLFDFENLPLDRSGDKQDYDFEEATVSSSRIDPTLIIDAMQVE
jgi:hypothetical protein